MEKVSLPKRTLTARTALAVPLALALMLLAMAWGAYVLCLGAADFYFMAKFRRIVISGQNISGTDFWGRRNGRWWTLFESGGVLDSTRGQAERAIAWDTWSGDMRYLAAQGFWREYNRLSRNYEEVKKNLAELSKSTTPRALTEAGNLRGQLEYLDQQMPAFRQKAITFLDAAIRNDPANAFYHMTRVGVLTLDEEQQELARQWIEFTLANQSPENSFGQMRKAEYLLDLKIDREAAKACCRRALALLTTPISHGLVDTTQKRLGTRGWPALADVLSARIRQDLGAFGNYEDWDAQGIIPERPEADWLLAWRLLEGGLSQDADKAFQRMVADVEKKLALQEKVTLRERLKEILWLPAELDYRERFLANREIERAAIALLLPVVGYQQGQLVVLEPDSTALDISKKLWSQTQRPKTQKAEDLLKIVLKREPRNNYARLILARLMLAEAATVKDQISLESDPAKIGDLRSRNERILAQLDENVAIVLREEARNATALALRANATRIAGVMPKAAEITTP